MGAGGSPGDTVLSGAENGTSNSPEKSLSGVLISCSMSEKKQPPPELVSSSPKHQGGPQSHGVSSPTLLAPARRCGNPEKHHANPRGSGADLSLLQGSKMGTYHVVPAHSLETRHQNLDNLKKAPVSRAEELGLG